MDVGSAISAVTPEAMLTVAGSSIILAIIIGAIIAAWKPTADQKDRFGPILAIVLGILVVGGFALVQGADVASAVLVGIISGAGSMGVHDASGALGGP